MSRARWSYEAPGSYRGCSVSVYAETNGMLYGRSSSGGRSKREALKHQDRDRAKEWAKALFKDLVAGARILDSADPTAAKVITAYLETRTPLKANENTRKQDARAGAMWQTILAPAFNLTQLSRDELDRFRKDRESGAIDAHGAPVVLEQRRPVRIRAVAADLEFLRAVTRWAYEQPSAKQLLRADVWPKTERGRYRIPKEVNPRRPVASHDRYETLRAVADHVHPFFGEILDLANETGSRLSAVLALKYSDLLLSEGKNGKVRWPGETDKQGVEWIRPLSRAARAAIDGLLQRRPGIGAHYLFPSPRHAGKPVSRHMAAEWLRTAEGLAGLMHLERGGFHAYRRKWGSERKHLPVQDVADAGGWKSLKVVQQIYQQPDAETIERVVNEPRRLREVKHG